MSGFLKAFGVKSSKSPSQRKNSVKGETLLLAAVKDTWGAALQKESEICSGIQIGIAEAFPVFLTLLGFSQEHWYKREWVARKIGDMLKDVSPVITEAEDWKEFRASVQELGAGAVRLRLQPRTVEQTYFVLESALKHVVGSSWGSAADSGWKMVWQILKEEIVDNLKPCVIAFDNPPPSPTRSIAADGGDSQQLLRLLDEVINLRAICPTSTDPQAQIYVNTEEVAIALREMESDRSVGNPIICAPKETGQPVPALETSSLALDTALEPVSESPLASCEASRESSSATNIQLKPKLDGENASQNRPESSLDTEMNDVLVQPTKSGFSTSAPSLSSKMSSRATSNNASNFNRVVSAFQEQESVFDFMRRQSHLHLLTGVSSLRQTPVPSPMRSSQPAEADQQCYTQRTTSTEFRRQLSASFTGALSRSMERASPIADTFRKKKRTTTRRKECVAAMQVSKYYRHCVIQPLPQADVLEDGLPPAPRAGSTFGYYQFEVTIKRITNLMINRYSSGSRFCCEVSLEDEVHVTPVSVSRNRECIFNHTVQLKIRRQMIEEVMDYYALNTPNTALESTPSVDICLFDCSRFARNDICAFCSIPLMQIVDLGQAGQDLTCTCETIKAEAGVAPVFMINVKPRQNSLWQPRTVAEVLAASEGELTLQPAQQSNPRFKDQPACSTSSLKREASIPVTSPTLHPARTKKKNLDDNDDVEKGSTDDETEALLHAPPSVSFYWKESLENFMNSLLVNILVMILVLIDIATIIFYTLILGAEAEKSQTMITEVTLSCFVLELVLRILAMGRRFFSSVLRIFDFLVVLVSVGVFIVQLLIQNGMGTLESLTFLRFVSRAALGLRVARVLLNLRRTQQVRGHLRNHLRNTVSMNKRRYVKAGFDLDLTYITSRVIGMAAPAFGKHSEFRNDINVVSTFLSYHHYGSFLIFNLCDHFHSSDGITGNYESSMLFNQVQRIPFEDHGPPLMVELIHFCEEASTWMLMDPSNVIAVHCKGGKGRTGLMISAFLLWSGHRKCALDAIELFTFRRTKDYDPAKGINGSMKHSPLTASKTNQTVEGPSQIRYIHYVEAILFNDINVLTMPRMHLKGLRIPVGMRHSIKGCYVSFQIKCMRGTVYSSLAVNSGQSSLLGGRYGEECYFCIDTIIWGDTRIEIFKHDTLSLSQSKSQKLMMFMVFNTCFYKGETEIVFPKSKIDIMNKDTNHLKTDEDFQISVEFGLANDLMNAEEEMRRLFLTHGSLQEYTCGDVIVEEDFSEELIYVVSGIVEGVCLENPRGDQDPHPLGCTTDQICQLQEEGIRYRVPTCCVLGEGTVLGAACFLLHQPNMMFKVRSTKVTVYRLKKLSVAEDQNTRHMPRHLMKHSLRRDVINKISAGSQAFHGQAALSDIALVGITEAADLAEFYTGLSTYLSTRLIQVQSEAMRIGSLRSYNDHQTILKDRDENERLRTAAAKRFLLPINEKLLMKVKCKEFRKGTPKRMRLIIFSNHIVFDPAFYSHWLASDARILRLQQLQSVTPEESRKLPVLCLRTSGGLIPGLDLAGNVEEVSLQFEDWDTATQMYEVLSRLCRKAEESRLRQRIRPFNSPFMLNMLQQGGIVHELSKSDKLKEASVSSSLFYVQSGEIYLLNKSGAVVKIISEGECFGESNFARRTATSEYQAVTRTFTVVLELPRAFVDDFLSNDDASTARFFYILSQTIERDTHMALYEAFPVSWQSERVAINSSQ